MASAALAKRPYMVDDLRALTDGELDAHWSAIDTRITELAREEEAIRARLDSIKQEFIRRFNERESDSTKTANYTISRQIDDVYPEVHDRQAFHDYILKTKALYLLQQRPSTKAITAELAFRKAIPGVRLISKETLSRRSLPKKRKRNP
jgi:hypothetical protein